MTNHTITLTDENGSQVKVGRSGLTNKSPLTPQDRMLIWKMLTDETGPAETAAILQAVWKLRQERGDQIISEQVVKVGIAWARRQIRRELDNQKLNTSEGKKLKGIISSLSDDFYAIQKAYIGELTNTPSTVKEDWFRQVLEMRRQLADTILKYMDKAKYRAPRVDQESLRKLRDNPPYSSDSEKYAGRVPIEEKVA